MARILQVCNSKFYLSHFLVPLVRELAAHGHTVECVCEGADLDPALLRPSVRIHHLPFPRSSAPLEFLATIQGLRRIVRGGRFDCVDSHNRNASIVGRVAAWLERVPVNLYTAHGFYFHDDQPRLAYAATVGLEAVLARITDHTLSQSSADVDFMTRFRWIAPSRIETIGNGIDTRRFSPTSVERRAIETRLGLRSGTFRVAATGRLVRGKGFTDLLDAFVELRRAHADAELLIIGGNIDNDIEPYHAEFQARAVAAGVADSVTVTGIVRDVESYLGASDVFVLPSYREGMPRALLEAMSMELPVIATDIRGCREIVRDDVDGWLFPPHDVARLGALLAEVKGDAARRAAIGKRGRERVCSAFDERDYVTRQVVSLERLLAGAGRRHSSPSRSPSPRAPGVAP